MYLQTVTSMLLICKNRTHDLQTSCRPGFHPLLTMDKDFEQKGEGDERGKNILYKGCFSE